MNTLPPDNGPVRSSIDLRPLDLERGERLLLRLTEFGRLLWEMGIAVGPHQLLELAQTLDLIDITNRDDFYHTLKCCLLTRHEQEPIFDQAFNYFWFLRNQPVQPSNNTASKARQRRQSHNRLPLPERKRLAEHLNTNDPRKELRQGEKRETKQPFKDIDDRERDNDKYFPEPTAYSDLETLRTKDFENFSWEEIQEAKRLLSAMHWHLGERATHRKAPAPHGSYPDLRRMVRRNLKHGAEMLLLTWREIKHKPRPLVIICDISGSMSLYSRLLLHFIHTITNGLQNVEAFVFGTRLTRITRQLQKRDVDEAVRDVSKSVQDWSGGTRIGEALHHFNYVWARRVLRRGAVVLLISDGWDRGEAETLKVEMDRLQHNCHRLIWLNPLLGAPDYRPLTIGMKTALPFVDDFLPAHNLNSLLQLGNVLSTIDETRPSRSPAARRKAIAAWTKPKSLF